MIDDELINQVAEIYDWIALQISENINLAGSCKACGKCCDFDTFGHLLFITPPELIYLTAKTGSEKKCPMTAGVCPYNINSQCSVHEYRFAGCRIFFCNGNPDFQSALSESAVKRFKTLCAQFRIPYRYTDLATMLNIPPGY